MHSCSTCGRSMWSSATSSRPSTRHVPADLVMYTGHYGPLLAARVTLECPDARARVLLMASLHILFTRQPLLDYM